MSATFNRKINRVQPKYASHLYKTFSARSPLSTHYRKATCAEVDCVGYREGFTLSVAALIAEGIEYAARHSGKKFKEVEGADYGVAPGKYLVFEAGQVCFDADSHRVSLERPEFFVVGQGDYRTFNARTARQHASAENWIDDMANSLDKVRTTHERG